MKILPSVLSLLALLCMSAAHAQLYKWVGPDGKITYTDTPPPANAPGRVETKPLPTAAAAAAELPFELAQAARNHPVTLYTTPSCPPCDEGRKLLTERGIPYRERTVTSQEDLAQLRAAGGDTQLPYLTVGRHRERGFESASWNNTLTVAGYPTANRLPRSYRQPPPETAAPRAEAPKQAEAKPTAAAAEPPLPSAPPPAAGNAPPGFRF
jgi:glutaredoxin